MTNRAGLLNIEAAMVYEPPPPAPPSIENATIKRDGWERVTVSWLTNEPTSTHSSAESRWKYSNEDLVTSHQVVLKPSFFKGINFEDGDMRRLQLASVTADGRRVVADLDFGGFRAGDDDMLEVASADSRDCEVLERSCEERYATVIELADAFEAACQDWVDDCRTCDGVMRERVLQRCEERSFERKKPG